LLESYKMKIQTQIKKIGDSNWILIPKLTMNLMKLKTKDIIEIDILDLVERPEIVTKYRCKRSCGEAFFTSDKMPYCSICGSEDLEEIK